MDLQLGSAEQRAAVPPWFESVLLRKIEKMKLNVKSTMEKIGIHIHTLVIDREFFSAAE